MSTDAAVTPFVLQNFVATVPGTTAPVTEFAAGADIALSWQSNGTAFTLYAAKDATPLYSGTDTSFVVRGGRTSATTFVLVASVSGGPDSGAPYPGFETISLVDALTVTISNPTLTPAAVTAGTLAVTGATTLQEVTTAAATVGGTLNVNGAATLSGGASMTNGLTVSGSTTLSGGASMDSASVAAQLSAGSASLGAATASSLSVSNWVAMMNPKGIGQGSYTPGTDGLVVGTVGYPSDAGKKCAAVAYGWTAATGYLYATGGNDVMWTNGDSSWMWIVGNSFVLPVTMGNAFQIGVMQVGGADVAAPTSFAWVPFGTSAQLTALTEAEAATAGAVAPAMPEPVPPVPYEPDFAITEVLDVLAEVAGGPLPESDAERLSSALRGLVTHTPL
jgi:hypothetical protein